MINGCTDTLFHQHCGHIFCFAAAHAINDTTFIFVFFYEFKNSPHLILLLVASFNFQTQIGPIKGRYEYFRIFQGQLLYNVFSGYFVSCSSQCYNRYFGKLIT